MAYGFYPIEEVSVSTYWWSVILLTISSYFFFLARISSGSYTVIRSTKESSRDIWILRNGAESEVDAFISTLREKLRSIGKLPNKAPEPTTTSGTVAAEPLDVPAAVVAHL